MMPDHIDELLSATESSTRNEAVWELQSFLLCGFILHTHPFWLVWLTLAITGISFLISLYMILVALPRKRRAYWETYAWEYEYDPGFTIRNNVVGDPDNLEGPGPTEEERRANARAIDELPVHERFALMFGHTANDKDV